MPGILPKRLRPDRGKIDMEDEEAVRCWTKHLEVSETDLQLAVEKVGNSAAAVRKQLGIRAEN